MHGHAWIWLWICIWTWIFTSIWTWIWTRIWIGTWIWKGVDTTGYEYGFVNGYGCSYRYGNGYGTWIWTGTWICATLHNNIWMVKICLQASYLRKKPVSVVFQSKIVRTQDPHLALFHCLFILTKAPESSSWQQLDSKLATTFWKHLESTSILPY